MLAKQVDPLTIPTHVFDCSNININLTSGITTYTPQNRTAISSSSSSSSVSVGNCYTHFIMALQTPLDETMWQCDLAAVGIHQLHSNTILPYFQMSPFYDQSSNNAILWGQAMSNANMYPLVQTREAFEGRLKTMSGVEFVVAQEPSEMAPGTGTGVWVINKQHRRKRHGMEDEVNVLATYFVVGEHIYMAPSMADVLSSRLVSQLACSRLLSCGKH